MLKKALNPFDIKVTSAGTPYVIVGTITSLALHGAFYFTIFHFIRKFW